MNIIINYNAEVPIYEQVYQQIRDNIVQGKVKGNEKLPSIRFLAKELQVSVITTKRAYEDLEKDGYIYTVKGKGSYVAALDAKELQENYSLEIKEHIIEILALADVAKITDQELMKLFKEVKEENQ
ncbi:GntR family transcriptional regulator [Erysipelothrix urinaevulpis]|uniref:GntR family transcriptional regulator n=1 Tax=Erysipelothrix urinaevulpis TaxID=2683717 RepID=UPI0013585FDB|nr:GntR family transcriptional regulator [Erysipelothrix urinaevulpis]